MERSSRQISIKIIEAERPVGYQQLHKAVAYQDCQHKPTTPVYKMR
jgi:hypothetical protein